MDIYDYQQAFGAWDKTTPAMRREIKTWFDLYYRATPDKDSDPCQRIAYTVVSKLVRAVFAEYTLSVEDPALKKLLQDLDTVRAEAMQLALVGGECYIKPWVDGRTIRFSPIPRDQVLIFGRDVRGEPVDVGTVEKSIRGRYYYTLLERRQLENGRLTVTNQLFRSLNDRTVGSPVPLSDHPMYESLAPTYTYPLDSIGLVRLKTPMVNCVDGSPDGVSVYAAAVGLIRAIDRNEALLAGEFERGQSRIIVSSDMLTREGLTDNLFVGLDDDPQSVGITLFSPALREQSFLRRKQEYLRNVESLIGLKRGVLSDAYMEERTATEIAASGADFNLTVMDFQNMWLKGLRQLAGLCAGLSKLYRLGQVADTTLSVDWGNGVLYDEEAAWESYMEMVKSGLLRPEVALGWRFNMPAQTQQEQAVIRERLMPAVATD